MAAIAGHPVLAEVSVPNIIQTSSESYANLGTNVTAFWLSAHEQADLTIVSPDSRKAVLLANSYGGPALKAGASLGVRVRGPGPQSYTYSLPTGGAEAQIPVELHGGVNRLFLSPIASAVRAVRSSSPEAAALLALAHLQLGSG
jgi:hypothetical protein